MTCQKYKKSCCEKVIYCNRNFQICYNRSQKVWNFRVERQWRRKLFWRGSWGRGCITRRSLWGSTQAKVAAKGKSLPSRLQLGIVMKMLCLISFRLKGKGKKCTNKVFTRVKFLKLLLLFLWKFQIDGFMCCTWVCSWFEYQFGITLSFGWKKIVHDYNWLYQIFKDICLR